MTEEFLIRLDEELPSDEKYAVKLIETQVLSQGYKEKIELLIDKVDKLAVAANVDVLREIKDVLAGMLESLNSINNKYAFVSELLLKLDDKVESRPEEQAAAAFADVNDRLRTLSEGLASLLADVQITIERKLDLLSDASENIAKLQDASMEVDSKLDDIKVRQDAAQENFNELQSSVERLQAGLEEKLGELSLGIPDAQGMHDKLDMLQLNHAQISPTLGSMAEAVGGLKLDIASVKSRQHDISQVLEGRMDALGAIRDSIERVGEGVRDSSEKLDERISFASSELARLDEKMNSISVGTAESIDKLDEKLNQLYMSYSEIASGLEGVAAKAEKISALDRIEEKLSGMPDEDAMEQAWKNQAAAMEELKASITEKSGEMAVAAAEAAAKIEEKLNDIYASSSHNLEKLESKVGEMSVAIAEIAAKDSESPVEIEDLKKEHERVANSVRALQDDIDGVKSQMKAYSEEILAALAKPAARKKVKKRKKARKVRRVRRRAARRRVRAAIVDNETLDTVIVNTLNTASMNIAQLRETTRISEMKLRERLNILMARGVVMRERRGRSIFYVSRAEQPMPTG